MAIQNILQEKREWKALQQRAKALPTDYYVVYKEMQKYLFKVGGADFEALVELFEQGAADRRDVLEVTGENVAAFCDELAKSGPYYDYIQKQNAKNLQQVGKAIDKSLNK